MDDETMAVRRARAAAALAAITDEEDRALTEAAENDPDNPIVSDEDFARARPALEVLAALGIDAEASRPAVRGSDRPLTADRPVPRRSATPRNAPPNRPRG